MGRRHGRPQTRARRVFLLSAFLGLIFASAAAAGEADCSKSWTGNGHDGNWNTPTNWNPSGAPGATDSVCVTSPRFLYFLLQWHWNGRQYRRRRRRQ
jgi:hypothetical protein